MPGSVSVDTSDAAGWRALGRIPLLAGLPESRLRALCTEAPARSCPAGHALRHEGDPASHLVLLLSGRVAATATTRAGRVVRFGEWTGPCALDKVAVIDGHGHTATLTALQPCSVRALPRDRFLAAVDDAPSVRRHVLRVLADQARHQREQLTATATLPAEARVAAWLLSEAAAADAGECVALPGGQQVLADLLGITRVTVSRALARLRREGLIAVDRRTVTLLAPELLALRADGR